MAVEIRSYVATMTNIASQSKRIEAKTLSTNSWKRCSKRLNTAKTFPYEFSMHLKCIYSEHLNIIDFEFKVHLKRAFKTHLKCFF